MSSQHHLEPDEPRGKGLLWSLLGIGVLGLLAAGAVYGLILVPAQRRAQGEANFHHCADGLHQVGSAALMYLSVHGSYPYATTNRASNEEFPHGDFAAGLKLLRAEGFYEGPDPDCAEHPSSQAPFIGLLAPFAPSDLGTRVPLAWDSTPHAGGEQTVVFSDGTVESLSESEFTGLLLNTGLAVVVALDRLGRAEAPARAPTPAEGLEFEGD